MKYLKITPAIIALTSILLLQACSGDEQKKTSEKAALKVSTALPEKINQSTIQTTGTLKAANSAVISTRMMGYVESVMVEAGEAVQRGEVLLKINSEEALAQKAQAESQVARAKQAFENSEKDWKRYQKLEEKGSISQKEFEGARLQYQSAKSQLKAAEQQLRQAEAQLEYSVIRAPFTGNVGQKFIEAGDMAKPGHPLLSVEGEGLYEVVSRVGESAIRAIKKGQSAEVYLTAMDKTYPAKVSEVSSSSRQSGGQYEVKLRLAKINDTLRPGMYAEVNINGKNARKTTLYIPEKELIHKGGLSGVYTVSEENTALLRWLKLGQRHRGKVQILSGLEPGERYIQNTEGKIYNGAPLKIQK